MRQGVKEEKGEGGKERKDTFEGCFGLARRGKHSNAIK
jgi:hypothetical protein